MEINEEIKEIEEPTPENGKSRSRKKAVATVITDVCTGCKICVPVCPSNCIRIVESGLNFNGVAYVEQLCCTGCNICAIDCPWTALVMMYPDGSRKSPAEYDRQIKKMRGYQ
jgi:Pyruvate/2-oxoacid:ferredoxin oxidoreductase delta subunit